MKFLALVLIAIGVGLFFSVHAPQPTDVNTPSKNEQCSDFDYIFGEKLINTTIEDWYNKSNVPNFSRPMFV